MDELEVECGECGWQGYASELHCSEEDFESDKPNSEIAFNRCPNCDSTEIYDLDDEVMGQEEW